MSEELQQEQQQESVKPDYTEEARSMGWVDKEDYKDDPSHWVDAETFVRRGKQINQILRKNNDRLNKELREAKSEIGEMKLAIKDFGEQYKKMTENAYKQAISEVKKQIREANREGDDSLAESLEGQLDTLKEEAANIKVPGQPKPNEPPRIDVESAKATLGEWMQENKWYNPETNPTAFHVADSIAQKLAQTKPQLIGTREFLDLVTEETRKTVPDAFKNPARKSGSPVSGSSEARTGSTGGKKSYADLPPEAKAACDRMTTKGKPGYIDGFTRDRYVQNYFEE